MPSLTLYRTASTPQGTPGILYAGSRRVCRMMELPDRQNRTGRSSIPVGTYDVHYMKRSASGRYRDVYHVKNVPGRGGILVHGGNYAGDKYAGYRSDSLGCLLPCSRLGIMQGQMAGLISRRALSDIHRVTGRQKFKLIVKNI